MSNGAGALETTQQAVQHCPDCAAEFVLAARHCSDCGGALRPGPLPARSGAARLASDASAQEASADACSPDTLISRMQGMRAEIAAKALTLEGIICLLECRGLRQIRRPNEESPAPLARTWPVAIYVAQAQAVRAKEIVGSVEGEDLIGDQWMRAATETESVDEGIRSHDANATGDTRRSSTAAAEFSRSNETVPPPLEGTGMRFLVLALLAGVLAFVVMRR